MTRRIARLGRVAIVSGIVLGVLTYLVGLQTILAVSIAGMVSAFVLVLLGVVLVRWPEGGQTAPRVMGAGSLVAGTFLGILVFGTRTVCVFMVQVDPIELFFYSIYWAFVGDPCSVTVLLGTVLVLAGIVMFASSLPQQNPPH